jgi:hypothetical protein
MLSNSSLSVRREIHPHYEPLGFRAFHPEDGGDIFLRNVGSYMIYKESSHHTRQHYSLLQPQKHKLYDNFPCS